MAEIIRINDTTYRVEDGHVRFYLLCGTERAALIDTGMTTKNAKEIVEGLTALPLIVINTHADRDHTAGNAAFAEVYMNQNEAENYRRTEGAGAFIPVKEGDVIDLGDRPLFIIDIPGHTPGSIAVLDEKNRVLISGDSVQNSNIYMFGKFRDMNAFIGSMEHLMEFDGRYDEVYPMHGTFPEKPEQVGKLRDAARMIQSGEAVGEPVDVFGNKVTLYRFDFAGFYCEPKSSETVLEKKTARPKTVIMVQHTQSVHHTNGHAGAWGDWDLTELGHEQAKAVGRYLAAEGVGEGYVMYASDLKRAFQTAEEIGKITGLTPVVTPVIREINAGAGNGKPYTWYEANKIPAPKGHVIDYRPFPDAESDRDLWNRLYPFYEDVISNEHDRILIVSHGTALSFLQAMFMGMKVEDRAKVCFKGRAGSVSRFEIDEFGRVTARYINREAELSR